MTQNPNAFVGQTTPPTEAQLAYALGPQSHKRWNALIEALTQDATIATHEWTSYSPKAGWALRLNQGKRAIVYLSPVSRGFTASFALGAKAMQAAFAANFPPPVVKILTEARRYAEGAAVRIDIRNAADTTIVRRLAAIKLAN